MLLEADRFYMALNNVNNRKIKLLESEIIFFVLGWVPPNSEIVIDCSIFDLLFSINEMKKIASVFYMFIVEEKRLHRVTDK